MLKEHQKLTTSFHFNFVKEHHDLGVLFGISTRHVPDQAKASDNIGFLSKERN